MAVLLSVPLAALAVPTLVYEGSLKLPDAGGGAHYPSYMVFVPNDPTGSNRPGWGGTPIVGPSLVVRYTNVNDTREWNALPALSKTSAGLLNATQLPGASGGTDYSGGQYIRDIDSSGNIWDTSFTSSTSPTGMYSNPGTHVLGGTTDPVAPAYKIQETGWPGSWAVGGFLKRSAGLPTDGTAIGATFVTSRRRSDGCYVEQEVRTGATTMVTTPLFTFSGTFNDSPYFIQYAPATDGEEFFIRWKQGGHTGNTFTIDLYDSTAAGADPTPVASPDIGDMIFKGAGFLDPNSSIDYVAVDWANSQLYVLDGGTSSSASALRRSAHIHVFTLAPPPIPEPAGLGLMGLALLAIRRKRS